MLGCSCSQQARRTISVDFVDNPTLIHLIILYQSVVYDLCCFLADPNELAKQQIQDILRSSEFWTIKKTRFPWQLTPCQSRSQHPMHPMHPMALAVPGDEERPGSGWIFRMSQAKKYSPPQGLLSRESPILSLYQNLSHFIPLVQLSWNLVYWMRSSSYDLWSTKPLGTVGMSIIISSSLAINQVPSVFRAAFHLKVTATLWPSDIWNSRIAPSYT